jgi:hypothetical protein
VIAVFLDRPPAGRHRACRARHRKNSPADDRHVLSSLGTALCLLLALTGLALINGAVWL